MVVKELPHNPQVTSYDMTTGQGPQGSQKLSSLKSHKNSKPPSIPGILTLATIRNGFQIDPQTTEILSRKAKCPLSERGSECVISI